eukprot:scaffold3014_cov172-Amphora_coffeaeformis.AAC.11
MDCVYLESQPPSKTVFVCLGPISTQSALVSCLFLPDIYLSIRKIANYPFTTIVPNLGVCDLGEGAGLVLCDIPGLIEGAAGGAGMVSNDGWVQQHMQKAAACLSCEMM